MVLSACLLACSGGQAGSGEDENTGDKLIGGQEAQVGDFPSTFYVAGERAADKGEAPVGGACTAVKIGPGLGLLAAHCVLDPATVAPRWQAGSKAAVRGNHDPDWHVVEIVAVHVHPAWIRACTDTYCASTDETLQLDAPDIAVVQAKQEFPSVPIAKISDEHIMPGDDVIVGGFGCTDGVMKTDSRSIATLKFEAMKIIPVDKAVHPGSPISAARLPATDANYALVAGPGLENGHAGLCPGDSGGPLYKKKSDGSLVVVGVNSNYTFTRGDRMGLPVTNWHTRVDGKSKHDVAGWLKSLGAQF